MTNRLELNWKLDGFVDEQRYYCSETPIDPENLPVPKAVLAGDVRAYVDTDVEFGKTYFVRVGSVKNGVEKLSDEASIVIAEKDPHFINVDVLLLAEEGFVNLTAKTTINANGNTIVDTSTTSVVPKFSDKLFFINRRTFGVDFTALLSPTFTLEFWGCPNFSNTLSWSEWWSFWDNTGFGDGDLYFVRNNNTSQMGAARTGKTPIINNGNVSFLTKELRHICIMSDGITVAVFVDGVINRTFAYSVFPRQWMAFRADFSSYIESLRLSRSVARYDMSGFIPPDKKFPNS